MFICIPKQIKFQIIYIDLCDCHDPTNNDIIKTQLILMGIVAIVPIIIASTPRCIDNERGSELSIAMHTNSV